MPPAPAADADLRRVGLLVLGMHRSGTSALTWLLGQMGAALPRDAMDAHADNAKGYWESTGLVAATDGLIRAARSSWFDPRPLDLSRVPPPLLADRMAPIRAAIEAAWGDAPLIAVKDPRLCRLVPAFADLLRAEGVQPRVVLMLRPAAEVAASLLRRDGTVPAYGHLLWLRHMLDAEWDSRALPRAIVSYDELLADWRGVAARIAPLMGKEGWQPDDGGAAIGAFLDPTLRHPAERDAPALPAELAGLAREAERAFTRLRGADDRVAQEALDQVRARWAATPWLEGDIVHDELRHRRAPAVIARAEPAEPVHPSPPAPARSEASPPPDPTGEARLIRDSGLFDADWYRATYPDSAEGGLDPADHYLRVGAARGYRPNPLFDTGYYARQMARRPASEGQP